MFAKSGEAAKRQNGEAATISHQRGSLLAPPFSAPLFLAPPFLAPRRPSLLLAPSPDSPEAGLLRRRRLWKRKKPSDRS
jgi:hypothetical protein